MGDSIFKKPKSASKILSDMITKDNPLKYNDKTNKWEKNENAKKDRIIYDK